MTRYTVQPRDRIFVKSCGFFSFDKNGVKNVGKNMSKSLNGKYSPGMFAMRHVKQSATDAFKTALKRAIQKAAEATDDLVGNKITNKITRFLNAQQKNSEIVTNHHDKEIHKKRYISPQERQETIDELRLK